MTLPRRFFLVIAAFLVSGAIGGCGPGPASAPLPPTTTTQVPAAPAATTRPSITTTTQAPATVAQPIIPAVPDPTTEAVPAEGAPTALCKDGSLSYSQHRSGTCSHHGGVAKWL